MRPVKNPKELIRTALKLQSENATGFLLSGGCDKTGGVPLNQFYRALKTVKKDTNLIVNIHPGFIDKKEAELLANTGIDCVSVDVIGSDKTIREVIGLDKTIEDYKKLLKMLYYSNLNVVPHICIGLHYGKLNGEFTAIEMLKTIEPFAIVLNSLMPTKGTEMANVQPPSSKDILAVIRKTRASFPRASLLLGCMRTRRDDGVEQAAIEAGVNGIVNPRKSTVEKLKSKSYELKIIKTCCAVAQQSHL